MDLKYWLIVAGIVILSYVLAFLTRKVLARAIKRSSARINEDPTKFVFLKNSVSFIIFTIALIVIFLLTPGLNTMGKGLFASAGIIAATIGFASQKVFANILSGIFILIFKPFGVRDTIEIGSQNLKGVVEEITLRHTLIRNYENRRIIIPNSLISDSTLINSSILDERIRKHIEIGISYDSDIDHAKQIITEEVLKHPKVIDVRTEEEKKSNAPNPLLRIVELGEYSIQIRAYVWANNNDDAWSLQCDIMESVKKRFDKEGIEIPFPYRTLVFKDQQETRTVQKTKK